VSPLVDWQEDEATLYQLYRKEQDAELKIRWHALWLLRKGHSLPETAQVVGIHPRTLFRWLSWYREGGIAAIRQHQKGNRRGRPSFLTPEQCDQLRQQAANEGFRTLRQAQGWVEQRFQVRYTLGGIRSLFRRLRICKKTPRPMAVQADPKVQEDWKEKTLEATLKEAGVTRQTLLVWADEMRVGLYGQTRRVWAPRGVKIRQRVQMERKWCYLLLAVQPIEGRLFWCWIENLKAESIAPVLQRWGQEGVGAAVVDRASGHQSAGKQANGIVLIFQPPYSPEVNPAERVFEELRRAIEGQVYDGLEEKVARVEEELHRLASEPERVRRLTSWSWIQKAWAGLPP
jgi:transposase